MWPSHDLNRFLEILPCLSISVVMWLSRFSSFSWSLVSRLSRRTETFTGSNGTNTTRFNGRSRHVRITVITSLRPVKVFCRSSHRWILVAMMSFPVCDLVMMTVIQTSRFTRSWCFMCSFIFRLSSDHSGQTHILLDPNKNMQNLETQVLFYLFDSEALDDCSCLYVFYLNHCCSRKNGAKLLLDWTGFEVLKWPVLTIITIIIITTTTVNTNFRIFVLSLFDCWMKLWQFYLSISNWMVPGVWMI